MSTTTSPSVQGASVQLRKLQILLGVALVLAAAALLIAVRGAVPKAAPGLSEAREFAVRDEDGNLRARLTATGITLVDKGGRMRAGVSVSENGAPNLAFMSGDGKVRAVIGLGSDDTPGITLHDRRGAVRARIGVGSDDAPRVTFYGEKGEAILALPQMPDAEAPHTDAPSATKAPSGKRRSSRLR